jgi:hypothetical protein
MGYPHRPPAEQVDRLDPAARSDRMKGSALLVGTRHLTPEPGFAGIRNTMAAGGAEARRAFTAMMDMKKIDVAAIEAARRG